MNNPDDERLEKFLSKKTDEDLFEETAKRWVMLTEIVCRTMMLYGYPPCMLCSFAQYCSVCAAYQTATNMQKLLKE